MSQIFILADFAGDKCTKTTAELATAAARNASVTAIVLAAPGAGATLAASVKHGPIANVLVVESADFATHGVAAAADAIAQVIAQKSPNALLIASHAYGKEVAGRVAVATDSGIITDATSIDSDLITTQAVFGGSTTVHAAVTHGTTIATIRANSIEPIAGSAAPTQEDFTPTISDAEIEALALANPTVAAALNGATPKKVIARAPKIVNIVI